MARRSIVALLSLSVASSGCTTLPDDGIARGEVLYQNCSQCHGEAGEGSSLVPAPQIAGLPAWYVSAQLKHFQIGIRGAHPDDVSGLKMRPMSRTLKNDKDVDLVAEYVASLPHTDKPPTLEGQAKGDPAKGQAAYATCSACHGADGKGNEALKAPPIAQLEDWYIVAQLSNFKGGRRGYAKDDAQGAQMAGMAAAIADEAAMADLAAYIQTL
jgi:cytochrome c oxidase subunit II